MIKRHVVHDIVLGILFTIYICKVVGDHRWKSLVCWQGRVDDLETELSQLREKNNKLADEKKTVEDRFENEYMVLKQDRDNRVAHLTGCIILQNLLVKSPTFITFSEDYTKDTRDK